MDDENLFEKIDALFEADVAHWDTPAEILMFFILWGMV